MPKTYTIEHLERGTKEKKAGGTMTGLWLTFVNHETNKSRKEFLMDWKSAGVIEDFENLGEGADIEIEWKKDGNFFNIVGVSAAGEGPEPRDKPEQSGKPAGTSSPSKYVPPKQNGPVKEKKSEWRTPAEIIRCEALQRGVEIHKEMLAHSSNFTKLLLPSKLTPELLTQQIVEMAGKFEAFVVKGETKIADAAADVNPDGVDPTDVDLPD
jgi:hypothetical protein